MSERQVFEEIFEAIYQAEYDQRGRPGETVESAMLIRPIWIGGEVRDAKIRGDINCLQNIAAACIARYAVSTDSHERLVTGVYAREVPAFLAALEEWDVATRQQG